LDRHRRGQVGQARLDVPFDKSVESRTAAARRWLRELREHRALEGDGLDAAAKRPKGIVLLAQDALGMIRDLRG
jgi:hypothetical protein